MKRILLRLCLFISLLAAAAAHAGTATIASLIADGASSDSALPLSFSPTFVPIKPARSATAWVLRPGSPIAGAQRPASVRVALYGVDTPQGREVLCAAVVKYFPSANGWQAYFRLDDEMLFVRQDGRWVPFVTEQPKVALGMGDLSSNSEGYYPYLRVVGVEGPLTIEGWVIDNDSPTTPSPLFPR